MKPRLIIEQKITAFTNIYRVFGAAENGEKASLVALAQQKRLAFKEKVSFYSDEEKSRLAFTLRAEKVLDVHGRYLVEDENGQVVGSFKKVFKSSLLNSTWKIMDADDNELYTVRESNMTLAIIRRIAGWLPYIGDLVEIIVLFFRYHFVFTDIKTGEPIGKYQKTTLFRDHYTLSTTDEAFSRVDWRVLAAMGVGLDALQSR
jgi:hypothetical protein